MRRSLRITTGTIALATALALAGCATSDVSTAAALAPTPDVTTATAVPPTPDESEPTAVTDAATCTANGDVMSITFNADIAVREGRMSSQEQQGWYRLATVVLDRVPTRGEGSVSEGVAALHAAAPPIALAGYGSTQIGSDDWDAALTGLLKSCDDAGFEVATTSFTGG